MSLSLQLVGELLEDVAGWAVDHEMGKAALGMSSPTLGPVCGLDVDAESELTRLNSVVNSHVPEQFGSEISSVTRSASVFRAYLPSDQRQMLINVLSCLNSGWYSPLIADLIEALQALNFGERRLLFSPSERKSNRLTRAKFLLQALQ